jgi:hypothetical protein
MGWSLCSCFVSIFVGPIVGSLDGLDKWYKIVLDEVWYAVVCHAMGSERVRGRTGAGQQEE